MWQDCSNILLSLQCSCAPAQREDRHNGEDRHDSSGERRGAHRVRWLCAHTRRGHNVFVGCSNHTTHHHRSHSNHLQAPAAAAAAASAPAPPQRVVTYRPAAVRAIGASYVGAEYLNGCVPHVETMMLSTGMLRSKEARREYGASYGDTGLRGTLPQNEEISRRVQTGLMEAVFQVRGRVEVRVNTGNGGFIVGDCEGWNSRKECDSGKVHLCVLKCACVFVVDGGVCIRVPALTMPCTPASASSTG